MNTLEDVKLFLVPFLRQRSMLSVMVILLSEMNSYRIRVAIAVLSPSSAPCLVLALEKNRCNHSLLPLNEWLGLSFKINLTGGVMYDNEMSENS